MFPESSRISAVGRKMTKPAVTILIDTYNHERFIEQAIASVLKQDFPPAEMEILVVDDGSTDRTPEIVRQFEPRVRLITKTNGGQASAFNAGIPEARGEIVAFLDGDDWWATNKLSRVMEAMAADPSLGIVGHGIVMVHLDGREQSETLREGFRFQTNTIEGARMFRVRGSFLGTSRMTIRVEILRRIGPVPKAIVIQADEYLFTLAAAIGGAQILPEPLTYYRLHDANGFQFRGFDPQRMRVKQATLAALARSISDRLGELGIDPQVRRLVVEFTQASADQLRLTLDGGWSWETAKTEWRLYALMHPDAPLSHRVFKRLVLFATLALPPKSFYSVQRKLAQSGFYLRARERWLPVPRMKHIQRDVRINS
jgi:glycosyltransferase involved in cell wall biosynthesis